MSRSWAERPISCALCLWTEIAPGRFGRPEVPAPCLSWRMPRALMRTSVSMCCSRFFFVFGSDEQLDLMCPIPQHLQHSRYAGSAGQLLTAVARHSARSSVPRVPHKLPRSRRSRGPSGMHTLLSHLRGSLIPPHTRAPLRNRSGEVGRFLAPSWRYLHLLLGCSLAQALIQGCGRLLFAQRTAMAASADASTVSATGRASSVEAGRAPACRQVSS